MEVRLLHFTPIEIVIQAIRICYNSISKSDSYYEYRTGADDIFVFGEKDKQLIKKIIKNGHTSTLEHLNYTFLIRGISRACSHQLIRHRLASYSQQSQRYVKQINEFVVPKTLSEDATIVEKYNEALNKLHSLYNYLVSVGVTKEDARYVLPNSATTKLIMTINARSLRNFFTLRMDKKAQWEIRDLAYAMFEILPDEHKFIFEDIKNQ